MPSATTVTAAPDALTERLDQGLGFLLRKAHRGFVRALARELAPHGITTSEWSVLRVLWHQQGLSQVDLAERLRVERASLTTVLHGLEGRGLLRRVPNGSDRRKVSLLLTAAGSALRDRLLPCGVAANRRAQHGLPPDQIEAARRLIEKLIANLEP